jgi:hypothetical protein
MKKLILSLSLLASFTASATLLKVLNNVAVNGSTNTSAMSAVVGIIPSQQIIIDTTGTQTNIIAASLDGTNFVNIATNVMPSSGVTNFQPTVPTLTVYYRVSFSTTNNTTNTVYFSY